ncbi:hypothetical protein ACJ4V0_06550 [Phreatobacter sp. HK31-P]
MAFEKPPGHDWVIFYKADDAPDTQAMTVFGVMTIEKAVEEARWSLDPSGEKGDYELLAIQRLDFEEPNTAEE